MAMPRVRLVSTFQIIIFLLAADLCWGVDLLPYTKQMHLIPSLVQDNMSDYIKGTELLEDILKDGTEVLVSHDPVERIERILYEKNNLS